MSLQEFRAHGYTRAADWKLSKLESAQESKKWIRGKKVSAEHIFVLDVDSILLFEIADLQIHLPAIIRLQLKYFFSYSGI